MTDFVECPKNLYRIREYYDRQQFSLLLWSPFIDQFVSPAGEEGMGYISQL